MEVFPHYSQCAFGILKTRGCLATEFMWQNFEQCVWEVILVNAYFRMSEAFLNIVEIAVTLFWYSWNCPSSLVIRSSLYKQLVWITL